MTITVDLTPEEDVTLREQAARLGTEPERLAHTILSEGLSIWRDGNGTPPELLPVVDEQGVFHEDRWQAVEERLAQLPAKLPVLPDAALGREALYQDHD
jgi:hypothetical protein